MLARAHYVPLCIFLVALFACEDGGCAGCGSAYLAELREGTLRVDRDFAASVEQWAPAESGAVFRLGDGLRTGAESTALLAMQPSGQVLVQELTTIRFALDEDGQARQLELESGSVEVETQAVDLRVQSAQGIARVSPGSRVVVSAAVDGPTTVSVEAGRAVIEQSGEERVVAAGEQFELLVGAALMEQEAAAEADAEPEQPNQPAQGRKGVSAGGAYEVAIPMGETATVHDASPPTSVGVTFDCPQGGMLELGTGNRGYTHSRARGLTHASVRLPAGSYRYRVRCLADGKPQRAVRNAGRIRVVTDAATRRLPAKAQRVSVDADGRNYRIQYSNRLPRFTFSWRDAPTASSYVLTVTRPGRPPIHKKSSRPQIVLSEGALGEGTHRYSWKALDGNAQSKPSTLQVTFENQGGTAYLAKSLKPGETPGTLELSGGALAQSRVSIGESTVPLGPQGRFRTEIPASNAGSVVVRVAHPSNGVHYYVRRSP